MINQANKFQGSVNLGWLNAQPKGKIFRTEEYLD